VRWSWISIGECEGKKEAEQQFHPEIKHTSEIKPFGERSMEESKEIAMQPIFKP